MQVCVCTDKCICICLREQASCQSYGFILQFLSHHLTIVLLHVNNLYLQIRLFCFCYLKKEEKKKKKTYPSIYLSISPGVVSVFLLIFSSFYLAILPPPPPPPPLLPIPFPFLYFLCCIFIIYQHGSYADLLSFFIFFINQPIEPGRSWSRETKIQLWDPFWL